MQTLGKMTYDTIKVRMDGPVCTIQIYRPEANNTINDLLITECGHALAACKESATIVVLEGLPDFFCFGADFQGIQEDLDAKHKHVPNPEPLYDLWNQLAIGPFITIAHVRGKVNAGGVGFVAACDIVIADETAVFSLSELLFGLFPACVLPFLIRRIGFQKAHFMTLMTKPILAAQALTWGLIDEIDVNSGAALNRHLLRLRRLSKQGILRYKTYMNEINGSLSMSKPLAIQANKEIFSAPENLENISRFVKTGKFPWDS